MQFDLQFVPVYGCSLGVFYYDPNLEQRMNGLEDVEEDEFFRRITITLFIIGIHITWF